MDWVSEVVSLAFDRIIAPCIIYESLSLYADCGGYCFCAFASNVQLGNFRDMINSIMGQLRKPYRFDNCIVSI